MNKRVLKYKLESSAFTIPLAAPVTCKLVRAAYQHGIVCLWYEVPDITAAGLIPLTEFYIVATGQPIPVETIWVATVESPCGNYIWHVYRKAGA